MVDGSEQLALHTSIEDGTATLRATGELDIYTAPRLLAVIEQLCAAGGERIAIDGSQLTFVDSAGLRALVRARDRADQLGLGFQIAAASPSLDKVLEMTGLHDVLR